MPSSVCLRSGLLAATSGVAAAGEGTLINGVARADGGVDAGTSGVVTAEGRVDGGTIGVEAAEGRDDGGRGGDDGRGVGVGMRAAGVDDGRSAGVDVDDGRGAGVDAGRGAGVETRAAGAGVEGDAAAAVTCVGNGAAAGIASAPHSESMSSVGGAIDGIGGRPLTRSLSDRLSVIALSVRLFTAGGTNQAGA